MATVVYTSETPYSQITRDFLARHAGTPLETLHSIDRRWRQLGKLAEHGMVGQKYI
jgi:hypothetical protein